MNRVQEAVAKVVGLDDVLETFSAERGEIADVLEQLVQDNQMLQRQIEDLDYLNLYDLGNITEVIPMGDRKKVITRLRRLRHDNPLAKQAVKLVVRFTLGRGVQWILASDKPDPGDQLPPQLLPPEQQSMRGIVPIKYEDPSKPGGGAPTAPAPPPPSNVIPFKGKTAKEEIILGEADPLRDIINSFWNDGENKLAFTTHKTMQTMLDDIVTDGEKFYACFEGAAEPYVKVSEIPLEEISHIIYNPKNRLQPVYYKRIYTELEYDGKSDTYKPKDSPKTVYYLDYRITDEQLAEVSKSIKIPASKINKEAKIFHVMINELWTKVGKRGISELYASREWFRVFREFMEGRAAINSAAQAISYVRKIKGGPTAVAGFTGKFGGLNVGTVEGDMAGDIRRLTQPVKGAVYDSNQSVDLEWLRTDTGAVNAKEDARMLLATAGAGVSTMVHYFGEGGDANLATAQSMELPMVKSYEDWQQFMETLFLDFFEYVIRVATDDETASEARLRFGFTFPPIITQDVVKYTTSWAQIVRDIAPNNMSVRKQAMRAVLSVMKVPNIDGLMPEIEAEMAQAEALRLQQQQMMAASLAASAANPTAPPPVGSRSGNAAPPGGVAPKVPNEAIPPNLKKTIAGRGVKAANGPKQA